MRLAGSCEALFDTIGEPVKLGKLGRKRKVFGWEGLKSLISRIVDHFCPASSVKSSFLKAGLVDLKRNFN